MDLCLEVVEPPQKIKRGRPKTINLIDMKQYQKEYYERNKEKTKGDIHCISCNVLHSKSNKTRHLKSKYHLERINLVNN